MMGGPGWAGQRKIIAPPPTPSPVRLWHCRRDRIRGKRAAAGCCAYNAHGESFMEDAAGCVSGDAAGRVVFRSRGGGPAKEVTRKVSPLPAHPLIVLCMSEGMARKAFGSAW